MFRLPKAVVAFCASIALAVSPMASGLVFAQGFGAQNTGLTEAAGKAGYNTNQACVSAAGGCIPQIIGQVVSALLGLFGALFLILIMYGGVQYMFAGGDPGKVKSATQTLRNAVLGMLVVTASYAIATYVITSIAGAVEGSGPSPATP